MKAYLILDLSIENLDGFMEYANKIPQHIEKHQGKYIVQGVAPEKMRKPFCRTPQLNRYSLYDRKQQKVISF